MNEGDESRRPSPPGYASISLKMSSTTGSHHSIGCCPPLGLPTHPLLRFQTALDVDATDVHPSRRGRRLADLGVRPDQGRRQDIQSLCTPECHRALSKKT